MLYWLKLFVPQFHWHAWYCRFFCWLIFFVTIWLFIIKKQINKTFIRSLITLISKTCFIIKQNFNIYIHKLFNERTNLHRFSCGTYSPLNEKKRILVISMLRTQFLGCSFPVQAARNVDAFTINVLFMENQVVSFD